MDLKDRIEVIASHADGKLLQGRLDRVGVVLLNQPAKRNAITLEMWEGLCRALAAFEADDSVRVVVYAGAGTEAFSAGADISQFAERRSDARQNAEAAKIIAAGRTSMLGFAKPSLACIQGICLGGGVAMALQADLRVAAPDAVFGIPAARMGLAYGIENMERLVAHVGASRARLMLYTAKRFDAAQALSMGLVDVVAQEDAVTTSLDLARTIAQNAPLSLQATRFTVEQALKPPEQRDAGALRSWVDRCMNSADYREGRTAFVEKRKAVFTGR